MEQAKNQLIFLLCGRVVHVCLRISHGQMGSTCMSSQGGMPRLLLAGRAEEAGFDRIRPEEEAEWDSHAAQEARSRNDPR